MEFYHATFHYDPCCWRQRSPASAIGTARADVSDADRAFIEKLAMAGQAEVATGETAAKSENSAIADFGKQMVQEHGEMNEELAALAKQKGVEPPTSASLTDQAKGAAMSVMPGATFDKQYVSQQLPTTRKPLALLEKQASSGDDPDLKALANESASRWSKKHITELEALQQQPGMQ